MKTEIEIIADRAAELAATLSHGQACFLACREAGIPEAEVPSTASIVSAMLTNREINPPRRSLTPAEIESIHQARLVGWVHGEAHLLANRELPGKANRSARARRVEELKADAGFVARVDAKFHKP